MNWLFFVAVIGFGGENQVGGQKRIKNENYDDRIFHWNVNKFVLGTQFTNKTSIPSYFTQISYQFMLLQRFLNGIICIRGRVFVFDSSSSLFSRVPAASSTPMSPIELVVVNKFYRKIQQNLGSSQESLLSQKTLGKIHFFHYPSLSFCPTIKNHQLVNSFKKFLETPWRLENSVKILWNRNDNTSTSLLFRK